MSVSRIAPEGTGVTLISFGCIVSDSGQILAHVHNEQNMSEFIAQFSRSGLTRNMESCFLCDQGTKLYDSVLYERYDDVIHVSDAETREHISTYCTTCNQLIPEDSEEPHEHR